MKRKIIEIDEALCTGCGHCVTACAEGALAIVDGKARVVKDDFCDGLGACIGDCPEGALRIVEREAPAFDPEAVAAHLQQNRGPEAVAAFRAEQGHGRAFVPPEPDPLACGCPGTAVQSRSDRAAAPPAPTGGGASLPSQVNPSDLGQWPVQLHLVPPRAPFLQDRELVVLSTCAPVASADVHWRFLRGRSVVVACPKLDRTEPYVEKLAGILAANRIPRVWVVRMEVPCCGGLSHFVQAARRRADVSELPVEEVVVGTDGAVRSQRCLPPPN